VIFDVPSTLSPSRISSFENCPLQFRFANLQGLPQPPQVHLVRGNAVHRALELLFGDEPAARTPSRATATLVDARAEFMTDANYVGLRLGGADEDAFWAECARLVSNYFEMEDPSTVAGAELETWVEAPIGRVTVRGYIDRMERDGDGRLVISDYKTGRAPSPNFEDKAMTQLQVYAYLVREMRGEMPAALRLYYVRDKVRIDRVPSEQSLRHVERRTTGVHDAIARSCESGVFATKKGPLCNFCAFKTWCPEFGGDPARAADEAPLAVEPR
jgi:putative RecB family exonuclease